MLEMLAEKLPLISSKLGLFGELIGKKDGYKVFRGIDEKGNMVLRTIKKCRLTKKITREPLKTLDSSFNKGHLTTVNDYKNNMITKIAYQENKAINISEVQTVVKFAPTDTIIGETRVMSNPERVIKLDESMTDRVYSEYKKVPGRLVSMGTSSYNIPTCSLAALRV